MLGQRHTKMMGRAASLRLEWHAETQNGEKQSYNSKRDPATMILNWHAGKETHKGEEQSYNSQGTQQQ